MSVPISDGTVTLLDESDIERTIARIAHEIVENQSLDERMKCPVVLLGIPSGGVPFARRLANKICDIAGVDVYAGALDITLYRDDLRRTSHRALRKTDIPGSGIDDAVVILVDDVLFSGRSVRAALDALRDLGRPSLIQLAVMIDRGHRELPIRANYVGKSVPTNALEGVKVNFAEIDGVDKAVLTRAAAKEEG